MMLAQRFNPCFNTRERMIMTTTHRVESRTFLPIVFVVILPVFICWVVPFAIFPFEEIGQTISRTSEFRRRAPSVTLKCQPNLVRQFKRDWLHLFSLSGESSRIETLNDQPDPQKYLVQEHDHA